MISLERMRELLGPDADGLSDQELEAIREDTYARVTQLINVYENQRRSAHRLQEQAPPSRPLRREDDHR